MATLVIYDSSNGNLLGGNITGDYQKPVGDIKCLEVEVPERKYIKGVDTTVTPHTLILEDYPPSELDVLKEQLMMQEQAILELSMLMGGGR